MKAGTIALAIGVPVVLGGGVAAFLLLRKRAPTTITEAQGMGQMQAALGAKAVSQMAPPGAEGARIYSANRGKGSSGTLSDPKLIGSAGKIVDLIYPGVGSAAANVVSNLNSKIGTGLLKKVPGLGGLGKKLKLW